jgi:hypothetical protein
MNIIELRERHTKSELTAEELEAEIASRRGILPTLVGWLYPGIVQGRDR